MPANLFRVLSLDGGGAKGFYTLGVLREIEALIGCPIHERFDLIFGTSTGSIIASLLALGKSVDEVHEIYKSHVPTVMKAWLPSKKTKALAKLAADVFGDQTFDAFKTDMGIVASRWVEERPMIFKTDVRQAHGREATFSPGFGVTIADAVQASCSAYPFFKPKLVVTDQGDEVTLIDGGFCANNPTLYALADAVVSMKQPLDTVRVVSIGVGIYPPKSYSLFSARFWISKLPVVPLLQKTLEINTQSMEQLRELLFKNIQTVRINEEYSEPTMATDMFEHDLHKLNILRQRGAQSYADYEAELNNFLT